MLTTVQDAGRWGWQARGVPVAGPMDAWSARLANRLVGNRDGAAVLEATLIGPSFVVTRLCTLAVTGACFEVEMGAERVRSPFVAQVPADTPVRFGGRRAGTRAYVAIDGSFALAPVLGSVTTHTRSRMGGIDGRALASGDSLPLGPYAAFVPAESLQAVTAPTPAEPGATTTLQVLAGSSGEEADAEGIAALCDSEFVLAGDSDRMAFRLEGRARWPSISSTLLSQPTVYGAIQLPPSGVPMLLMADRQTVGGYAQIAVVTRADRGAAGQLGPGDRVRFAPTTWEAAAAAYAVREQALTDLAREVTA